MNYKSIIRGRFGITKFESVPKEFNVTTQPVKEILLSILIQTVKRSFPVFNYFKNKNLRLLSRLYFASFVHGDWIKFCHFDLSLWDVTFKEHFNLWLELELWKRFYFFSVVYLIVLSICSKSTHKDVILKSTSVSVYQKLFFDSHCQCSVTQACTLAIRPA